MSYEELRKGIPEPKDDIPLPKMGNGKTAWDVVYMGRRAILAIVILLASAVILYLIGRTYGIEPLMGILEDYWPAVISPLAGWYLGKKVAKDLYKPDGRLLISLNPETHMFRLVFVPEKTFKTMSQTGNNVVYHTPSGLPAYTVRELDLNNGRIVYGWVHENDALVVMTRESAYKKWNTTLDQVMEDNLELMVHPHIIGLGYARKSLRSHLDGIAEAVGFTKPDYEQHSTNDEKAEGGDDDVEGDRIYPKVGPRSADIGGFGEAR